MGEKVRWGIISTAGIAERSFIPALSETDRGELVAVASRNRDRADAFAKSHAIPVVFNDYAALLESDEIDAIYNPLPNTMHAEWTIAAAENGKHIFCEKPLAVSRVEIDAMVESCDRSGVQLVEAFVFLFHDQTRKLRQLLEDGVIGNIVATQAYMYFRIQRPSDNIRLNKELGGGTLLDGGVCPLTFTRFVYGEEPLTVQASCLIDPEYEVDTRISAVLEFSGGRQATIQVSIDGPGGPGATIYGEKGSITVPQPYHPRKGAYRLVKTPDGEERIPLRRWTTPVHARHRTLPRNSARRKTAGSPGNNALGTLAIVEAIFESARSGNRITL